MATNQENINIKATLDTTQFDNSLKGMQNEIKALNKVPLNLISDAEKAKVQSRIAELRKSIKDLRDEQRALAAENPFQTLGNLITPLAGAFSAAAGALSLFGVENEKLNKILQASQSLTIGLMALNQLRELEEQKLAAIQLVNATKKLIIDKLTFKQTVQQAAAETALNNTRKLSALWTGIVTKAQWAWNAAITANPIGALVVAIAALVAGIIILVKWLGKSSEAEENQKEAIDGTKFATEELMEAQNKHIRQMQDLEVEYRNAIGAISDFEAEVLNLENAFREQLYFLENEYKGKIKEVAEDTFGFWSSTWAGLVNVVTKSNIGTEKQIEKYAKRAENITEQYYGDNGSITNLREEHEEKLKILTFENELKIAEDKKKRYAENSKAFLDAINKDLDALRNNLSKMKDLFKQREGLFEDIKLKVEYQDLTELEKKLKDIEREAQGYANTLGDIDSATQALIDENNRLLKDVQLQRVGLEAQLNALNSMKNPYEDLKKLQEERLKLNIEDQKQNEQRLATERESEQLFTQEMIRLLQIKQERKLTREEEEKINKISDAIKVTLELISNLETQRIELASQNYRIQSDISNLEARSAEFSAERLGIEAEYQAALKQEKLILAEIDQLRAQGANTDDAELRLEIAKWEAAEKKKVWDEYREEERRLEQEHALAVADYRLEVVRIQASELQRENDRIRKSLSTAELEAIKKLEQEKFEIQKDAIKKIYDVRIEAAAAVGDNEAMAVLIEQQKEALDQFEDEFTDRWKNISQTVRDQIAELTGDFANTILQIFINDTNAKFELLNEKLQEETQTASDSLDKLRDANLISEEEYENRQEELQAKSEKKQKDLRIRQAKADKKYAIFQILIDTAMAVAKSFGQGGGLLGIPLAAIAAAQGALQLALVASQPIPEFAKGGKIKGRKHALGGTVIEAEEGEFVVNRSAVAQPGVEQLLNMMNRPQQTQQATVNTGFNSDQNIISQIVQETVRGISSIPVISVETDVTRVQRKVSTIEARAKF